MKAADVVLNIHVPQVSLAKGFGWKKAYLQALCRELQSVSEEWAEDVPSIIHLYGAYHLGDAELEDLFIAVRKVMDLSQTEIVVEMAPHRMSTGNMTVFRNARASSYRIDFGTFNIVDFKALNRGYDIQVYHMIHKLLRSYQMHNVTAVLYCGVPGQNEISLQDSIGRALELEPDGVCLKPYSSAGAGMSLIDGQQMCGAGEGDDMITKLQSYGASLLEKAGYQQTVPGEFVRQGVSYRYLQDEAPETIWGLGCGAITQIDGIRMQNTSDLDQYIQYAGDVEKCASYLGTVE